MPDIAVVTTSFCKARYIKQLKTALESQSTRSFYWWILDNSLDRETPELLRTWDEDWIVVEEHPFTEEERMQRCPHTVLLNYAIEHLPQPAEYFIHISDDDLPDQAMLATLQAFLRFNRDKHAAYVPVEYWQEGEDGRFTKLYNFLFPQAPVIFGPKIRPLQQLDGNSVLFEVKALLDRSDCRWPTSWEDAEHADGSMLNQFCTQDRIWPASSQPLLMHRVTMLSAWRNARLGGRTEIDPLARDLLAATMMTEG